MKSLLKLIVIASFSLLLIGCSDSKSLNEDMAIKLSPKYKTQFHNHNINRLVSSEATVIDSLSGATATVYMYDRYYDERLNFLDTCMIENDTLEFLISGFDNDGLLYVSRLSQPQILKYGRKNVFIAIDKCLDRMLTGLDRLNEKI
jgi:hypothetical protein